MEGLLNIWKKWLCIRIDMNDDKTVEQLRYDSRAQFVLEKGTLMVQKFGSQEISPIYRSPYVYYENCIQRYIKKYHKVLELGSGTGLHTYALVKTGAHVTATDISTNSLKVLLERIKGSVNTQVADMEYLPFKNCSFDLVCCAGSLSYGDPNNVDMEIKRVLRPGGIFICVDSLNHNPVYRFNRWLHYLKKERTISTLIRMPTMDRIQSIVQGFEENEVRFFGTASYLMPFFARIVGQQRSSNISDVLDRLVNVRKSAFKFVLVAKRKI
jgi:SAM-dependent methyltransferase